MVDAAADLSKGLPYERAADADTVNRAILAIQVDTLGWRMNVLLLLLLLICQKGLFLQS